MSNEIAVAMCVYNAAGTVRQALDSLLNQTYQAFDLIVVDDGSSDGTGTILSEYEQRFTSMTIVRQKNGGVGVARNAALNLSHHTWLAFIDSDDVWHPFKLEAQIRMVENTPDLDALVCGQIEFLHDAEIESNLQTATEKPHQLVLFDSLAAQLLLRNFDFPPASVLWRRSQLLAIGGYGLDRNGEDFQPFLMMGLSRRKVGRIPEALYFCRVNHASLSRSYGNHYVGAMARITAIDRILKGVKYDETLELDASDIQRLMFAKQRFLRWALHGVRTEYPRSLWISLSWPLIKQLDSYGLRVLELLKILASAFAPREV